MSEPDRRSKAGTAKRRGVTGDRPAAYLSRESLASELQISESQVDSLVMRAILPKPIRMHGSVRWRWAEVDAALMALGQGGEVDPFMQGVGRVA